MTEPFKVTVPGRTRPALHRSAQPNSPHLSTPGRLRIPLALDLHSGIAGLDLVRLPAHICAGSERIGGKRSPLVQPIEGPRETNSLASGTGVATGTAAPG